MALASLPCDRARCPWRPHDLYPGRECGLQVGLVVALLSSRGSVLRVRNPRAGRWVPPFVACAIGRERANFAQLWNRGGATTLKRHPELPPLRHEELPPLCILVTAGRRCGREGRRSPPGSRHRREAP